MTNLLLNTHTFLWFVEGNPKLSPTGRLLIEDAANNQSFLSIASIWEMVVKSSLGRLTFTKPFEMWVSEQISLNGFELLAIEVKHTAFVAGMAFHHRDPFDRMLIAQSLTESMPVVSSDVAFDAYGVQRLW